ncbi:hypothetical protein L1887_37678 [Cichorium endivia]|nr:hypothetical protein L1887_37678 [Cichorium endivia]
MELRSERKLISIFTPPTRLGSSVLSTPISLKCEQQLALFKLQYVFSTWQAVFKGSPVMQITSDTEEYSNAGSNELHRIRTCAGLRDWDRKEKQKLIGFVSNQTTKGFDVASTKPEKDDLATMQAKKYEIELELRLGFKHVHCSRSRSPEIFRRVTGGSETPTKQFTGWNWD